MDIILGKERRRWPIEDKRRIVLETFAPGSSVHAVAKRYAVNPAMLFSWRKRFRDELGFGTPEAAALTFTPVIASDRPDAPPAAPPLTGLLEIEFANGARLRIRGAVERTTVSAAISAILTGLPRR